MSKTSKKERKEIKRAVRAEVMKPIPMKKFLADTAYTGFNKVAKFLNSSSLGVHTPYGSIGMGFNGITINPRGQQQDNALVTSVRTGKRTSYFTGVAPKFRGYPSGLRVVGSQVLSGVVQATGSQGIFGGGGFVAQISPDAIGGQMALDARNYNRYRFSSLIFEYIPNVAVGAVSAGTLTTIAQNFVMAYISDAAVDTYLAPSYSNLQNVADNTVVSVWTHGGLAAHNIGAPQNLYYTENDTSSATAERMTEQGVLSGAWNALAAGTGSAVLGEILVHFVLDLYDRSADYGFTITVEPEVKIEVLSLLIQRFGEKVSRRSLADFIRLTKKKDQSPSLLSTALLLAHSEGEEPTSDFEGIDLHPKQKFQPVMVAEQKSKR